MEALCTNGKRATSISVEERHDGVLYIYGYYYENGKKHKCYVGPESPDYVLRSLPVAFLVEPDAWGYALLDALERAARNAREEGRPEVLRWLRRIRGRLDELLRRTGEAAREEGEGLPA